MIVVCCNVRPDAEALATRGGDDEGDGDGDDAGDDGGGHGHGHGGAKGSFMVQIDIALADYPGLDGVVSEDLLAVLDCCHEPAQPPRGHTASSPWKRYTTPSGFPVYANVHTNEIRLSAPEHV